MVGHKLRKMRVRPGKLQHPSDVKAADVNSAGEKVHQRVWVCVGVRTLGVRWTKKSPKQHGVAKLLTGNTGIQ